MIDSITLENWKTHKNSTLKFRKGTNVMVGVIGSGKSSVTDALCYGLFGTFPALQNRRVSTDDLLMRKPVSADQARVEVCFRIGDNKYRVERIVKRTGTNEGRLYLNDNLLVGPKPSQVTERVEHELQVTYELFSRAVYSEQNQVDYFLKLNPADRKKKFDELLDLQKYETVRANANQVLNQFRKSQESDKHVLAQLELAMQNHDVNDLRSRLMEQQSKHRELETKREELSKQKLLLTSQKSAAEEKVKKLETISQRVHTLKSKKDVLHGQWSVFEKQHADLAQKNVSELENEKNVVHLRVKEYASKQEQHRLLELQLQRAAQRKELSESRLSEWSRSYGGSSYPQLVDTQQKVIQQKGELKAKHASALEKIQEIVSAQKVFDAQLVELSNDEKSFASLHANCPTCKQEINPAHKGKLLHDLGEHKKNILQQMADFSAVYSKILTEKNGCETILRTLEDEEKRMAVLLSKAKDGEVIEKEISIAVQDVALAQSSLERFGSLPSAEEMDGLRSRGVKLDKALEMLKVKDEMALVDKQLVENESSLKTFAPARGEYNQLFSKFSTISSETDACAREMQLVSSMVHELSERVAGAEKLGAQKAELHQRLSHAQSVEEVLGVFSQSLVVTQQQLREGVIEAINAALQELWPSVYPYEDFSLAKVLIQDNDYVLTVKEKSGNWISAESSLSGGERSAAALALRMAIAFVLTRQLSWIILDEPTHNLDTKSVQALSFMLRERLPSLVDQVFVITHSSEIEKAATGSLYVMQREKNEDGITIPLNKLIDSGTKII